LLSVPVLVPVFVVVFVQKSIFSYQRIDNGKLRGLA
jgi:hypothetical protein